jgi:hypothetical protein
MDMWLKFFPEVDLTVIFCIAVFAYMLEYSKKVPDYIAMFVPMVLGGLFGFAQSLSTTWSGNTAALIFKGVMLNGAAASVMGRLAHKYLEKLWTTGDADAPNILEK